MTNVVYKNLSKDEAEQMAFELEVEGRFEFEIKEEAGGWSVHYWSAGEGPTAAEDHVGVGPAGPAGGAVPTAAPTGLAEPPAAAPVAPVTPPPMAAPPPTPAAVAPPPMVAPTAAPPAAPTPAPTARPAFTVPAGWRLGTLSSKYETSGRGPGTVSSGQGDPGGVSYGSYQMTSRGGGTVLRFVSDPAFPWRDRFAGLTSGSDAFSAAWRALAAERPDAFFAAQHAYIQRTHFDPLVRRVRSASGLDLSERSHALQDAAWSTAVQHGPNTSVVTRAIDAVGGAGTLPAGDLDGDRRLIRAIYAERGRRGADGRLAHFPRVESVRVQQSLANRFVNEEQDALAMLDGHA